MEDINFEEDINLEYLTKVKNLKEYIESNKDIPFRRLSFPERVSLEDAKGVSYTEVVGNYGRLKKELGYLPYLIFYNGVVYRAEVVEEVYRVKRIEVSGERESKELKLEVVMLRLHRKLGLDNNLTEDDSDKLVYGTLDDASRYRAKNIILTATLEESREGKIGDTRVADIGDLDLVETKDYLLKYSEKGVRDASLRLGKEGAIGDEERVGGTLNLAIELDLTNNLVEELQEATDSQGNTLFDTKITLEDLQTKGKVYAYKLYNRCAHHFTGEDGRFIQYKNPTRNTGFGGDFNLILNKTRMRKLIGLEKWYEIDNEEVERNKELIVNLLKESIIMYSGSSYYYSRKSDRFKMHREFNNAYRAGLSWGMIFGNTSGKGNRFEQEGNLELTNVYTREVYAEDIDMGTPRSGKTEEFNILYVYNNGRRISQRIGLKEQTKLTGYEVGMWYNTVDYILEDNKVYGYTSAWSRCKGVPVRLNDTNIFKGHSVVREDVKLPLENKLSLSIGVPIVLSQLGEQLTTYFKVRGDSEGEDYLKSMDGNRNRGVVTRMPGEFLKQVSLDVNNVVKDSYARSNARLLSTLGGNIVTSLPELNTKGINTLEEMMYQRDGALVYNIYLDKDVSESLALY